MSYRHRRYRHRYGHYAGIGCLTWVLACVIYGWPWMVLHGPPANILGVAWLAVAVPATLVVARSNRKRYLTSQRKPPVRMVKVQEVPEPRQRVPLQPSVKQAVWVRDGGRCRHCLITDAEAMAQAGEHLQFDHIRPWSWGGADTADNIQLLCGPCNRAKSASYVG